MTQLSHRLFYPGYFMNCRRETVEMGVPPGNRPALPRDWLRGVPERYVAGADTRGRPEGRPYPGSQQVIHGTSGLGNSLTPIVERLYCQRIGYTPFQTNLLP